MLIYLVLKDLSRISDSLPLSHQIQLGGRRLKSKRKEKSSKVPKEKGGYGLLFKWRNEHLMGGWKGREDR